MKQIITSLAIGLVVGATITGAYNYANGAVKEAITIKNPETLATDIVIDQLEEISEGSGIYTYKVKTGREEVDIDGNVVKVAEEQNWLKEDLISKKAQLEAEMTKECSNYQDEIDELTTIITEISKLE